MDLQQDLLSKIRYSIVAMALFAAGSAQAISVSNKAIDELLVWIFCIFEVLLVLVFMAAAAVASKRGRRKKQLFKLTPWMLIACVVSTSIATSVHANGRLNFHYTDTAILYCGSALVLLAMGLTVYAFIDSRKVARQ